MAGLRGEGRKEGGREGRGKGDEMKLKSSHSRKLTVNLESMLQFSEFRLKQHNTPGQGHTGSMTQTLQHVKHCPYLGQRGKKAHS